MTFGSPLRHDARVVVTLPRWVGDAVEVEPAVAALVEHVGPEQVTLDVEGAVERLYARRFHFLARGAPDGARHDVAVLLRGSFRSAWRAFRAGVPRRVGWARDGRGWLLTDLVTPALERGRTPLGVGRRGRRPRHLPRSVGAEAVELLGLLGVRVDRRRPSFEPSPAARTWAAQVLVGRDAPAVVNLGARAGSSKGFPAAFAGRLLDALADRGLEPVGVSAPAEHGVAEAALAAASERAPLLEPNLDELLAVLERASVVVTPDGGVRHLATAAGAPRVVAFASTDPRHSAPAGVGRELGFAARVACGPCHLERCPRPGAEHLACWGTLAPEELADAAAALVRGEYHRRP